jgi:hypothetical protein
MINGIQTRGGCSCAGTYGHFLHVDQETSHKLIDEISLGDLIRKPGWMNVHSSHTTTTEIEFVCNGIKALENHKSWALDYEYNRELMSLCIDKRNH